MRHNSSRTIKVRKVELIERIKANKEQHLKDYEEAVIAYRLEAKKRLAQLKKSLDGGSLNLALALVTPVNKSEEYDKLTEMFTWEVEEVIELSQSEFNEYVLDETPFSAAARMANASYKGI